MDLEHRHSLADIESYNIQSNIDVNDVIELYLNIILESFNYLNEKISNRNKNIERFIIKRGIDTISNIFIFLIYKTKNLNLVRKYANNAIFLYIEFIEQITQDCYNYLNFKSRDS